MVSEAEQEPEPMPEPEPEVKRVEASTQTTDPLVGDLILAELRELRIQMTRHEEEMAKVKERVSRGYELMQSVQRAQDRMAPNSARDRVRHVDHRK